MKLTRRQMVLGSVLVVTVGSLIADRIFLGDEGSAPQKALATTETLAPRPTADIAAPAAEPPPSSVPVAQTPQTGLAKRLEELAKSRDLDPAEMRDAFSLDGSWSNEQPVQGDSEQALQSPAEAFASNHRLQAVMLAGKRGGAQVNGFFLTIGQSIGAFQLVEVTTRSAIFQSARHKVILQLQDK